LKTFSYQIEARYRFLPRVFVAARVSQISFSDIDDPEDFDDDDELREPWDNDVRQISLGFGYYVNRHMLFKVMGQANRTSWERGGDPDDDRLSVQGVVYF
jgi:predicted porin